MLEPAARLDQGQRVWFAARAQLKIIGKRSAKVAERATDSLFRQLRPTEQGKIFTHSRLRLRMRQAISLCQHATHETRTTNSKNPRDGDTGVEPKGPVKCPRVMRFQVSV